MLTIRALGSWLSSELGSFFAKLFVRAKTLWRGFAPRPGVWQAKPYGQAQMASPFGPVWCERRARSSDLGPVSFLRNSSAPKSSPSGRQRGLGKLRASPEICLASFGFGAPRVGASLTSFGQPLPRPDFVRSGQSEKSSGIFPPVKARCRSRAVVSTAHSLVGASGPFGSYGTSLFIRCAHQASLRDAASFGGPVSFGDGPMSGPSEELDKLLRNLSGLARREAGLGPLSV